MSQQGTPKSTAGRRAYQRYKLALSAQLTTDKGIRGACEIRDFCAGGMSIRYRGEHGQPMVGDVFSVECSVPAAARQHDLRFQARVVRTVEDGIGVAFIDPQRDALQAMHAHAMQLRTEEQEESSSLGDRTGSQEANLDRSAQPVFAQCDRLVMEAAEGLLKILPAKMSNRLFDNSRDTRDPSDQADYFSASDAIRSAGEQFCVNFKDDIKLRLEKPLCLSQTGGPSLDEISLENMSLIQDEELSSWLAVADVTSKIEEKHKETLSALNQRLSALYGVTISHANNPYGPALFAEAFEDALAPLKLRPVATKLCHEIFKEMLEPLATALYENINDELITQNVLPDLTPNDIRRMAIRRHAEKRADSPADKRQRKNSESQPTPDVTPAREATASLSRDPKEHFDNDAPPNLFQVVQELRELRREFAQHGKQDDYAVAMRASNDAPGMGASATPPETAYSTEDVVSAIISLQSEQSAAPSDDIADLRSRVMAFLEDRGGDNTGKGLSAQDSNTLEVTNDLFHAMRDDPLVASSVRPWLKQLEMPVLKYALTDPKLFVDPSHVARQVVNKLAQLEFYDRKDGVSAATGLHGTVERLLQKAVDERADVGNVFGDIQQQLDKLINLQDLAFTHNLNDVVAECERQPPNVEPLPETSEKLNALSQDERDQALMLARRLHVQDWLLYSPPGVPAQRLCIAWMDVAKEVYVLVNMRGLSEISFHARDVAWMIKSELLQVLENAAEPAMDRAQYVIMQKLYQQVVHESTHDPMTGLMNRREFESELDAALAEAKRTDNKHVLCFVDIDKFNVINNNYGYSAGDRLLLDIAGFLQGELSGRGHIARLGSDQFGMLIEHCLLDDALDIVEKQIEVVADHCFDFSGDTLPVTISVGLVPITARNNEVGPLLQAAESSCAVAKDAGGNRLQVYHAGHARIAHRGEVMKWLGKIDKILEQDLLEINCQRIQPLAIEEGQLPHYEILVGVSDTAGAAVDTHEFIRAAEWYRRMPAVDRHIIRKVLAWMAAHPEVVKETAGFAINLSGLSISEEGFDDFILEELERAQVPLDKISFEVTETVGISNLSDASLFIERIREVGCRFSLDDFGSGMSSYGYLKNLPVDTIKIDGAFVKDIVANPNDYAVVKSITEIAHFMNKKVVAEYVESEEAMALLRKIGVDYGQGYCIDKPGPIDRLADSVLSARSA